MNPHPSNDLVLSNKGLGKIHIGVNYVLTAIVTGRPRPHKDSFYAKIDDELATLYGGSEAALLLVTSDDLIGNGNSPFPEIGDEVWINMSVSLVDTILVGEFKLCLRYKCRIPIDIA